MITLSWVGFRVPSSDVHYLSLIYFQTSSSCRKIVIQLFFVHAKQVHTVKVFLLLYTLTCNSIGIFLLEHGQRGDDETEGGDDHKQAGHYRHHLGKQSFQNYFRDGAVETVKNRTGRTLPPPTGKQFFQKYSTDGAVKAVKNKAGRTPKPPPGK